MRELEGEALCAGWASESLTANESTDQLSFPFSILLSLPLVAVTAARACENFKFFEADLPIVSSYGSSFSESDI